MDNNILNKLTNSAKDALENTSQEILNLILEEAYNIAQRKKTADKEISLSDILDARDRILTEKIRSEKNEYKKKRMSYLLGLTGATYATIGLVIYIYQNKNFNLSSDIGLIIAAVGIIFSLVAFFYQQFYSRVVVSKSIKDSKSYDEDFVIVKNWQIIENLTRELMIKTGFDENKSSSFTYLINFLDKLILDENKRNKLRLLLKSRNLILHENYQLSRNERLDLLDFSYETIGFLEENIKQTSQFRK